MPPKTNGFSARPPTHRSMSSTPVLVTPLASFAQACRALLRKLNASSWPPGPPGGVGGQVEQRLRGSALVGHGRGGLDRRVRAVGRDEVHQRLRVPQAEVEVGPARRTAAGRSCPTPSKNARRASFSGGTPASRARAMLMVGEVERQAQQVVAQRLGDELVDLVADLAGHAPHDAAGRLVRGERPAVPPSKNSGGLRKASIRPMSLLLLLALVARDGLGQHRVPEPVDGVGELGADRGVDLGVVARATLTEEVDHRLHLAGELLEHQVLVLHLGDEARGLEQPLAVLPVRPGRVVPVGDVRRGLGRVDQACRCRPSAGCARSGRCGARR